MGSTFIAVRWVAGLTGALAGACVLVSLGDGALAQAPPVQRGVLIIGGCPVEMVQIPQGIYKNAYSGVWVRAVCMDRFEVTTEEYAACAKCDKSHLSEMSADGAKLQFDSRCNYGKTNKKRHPINCVDWAQATAYCEIQGKRLPSVYEWQWAARGATSDHTYPWGEDPPDFQACWSGIQKRQSSCEVGTHPRGISVQGVHDLAGNVWEWTATVYDSSSTQRVHVGGGWMTEKPDVFRADHSGASTSPRIRTPLLGFRCVTAVSRY